MRSPVLLLGCALLAACNFPADDNAPVGSKGLWVANGTHVVEYNPGQLQGATGSVTPHVSINSEIFGAPDGVAFDPRGNLWVVDSSANINGTPTPALYEFSAAQLASLATDNSPDPVAVITSTFLQGPRQIVIDVLGNAWITDLTANAVMTYTAAQLSQSGPHAIAPVLFISSSQFNGVSGIAFDSNGNLWVANNGTAALAGTTIVEITQAHIPAMPEQGTTTTQLVADVTLSDVGGATIEAPWALAFDSSNALWSTNSSTSTIVSFAAASLVTGAPAAAVTLSGASIDHPHGVCIDDVGNLAVVVSTGINVFAPSQTSPSAVIKSDDTGQGCTFGPAVK